MASIVAGFRQTNSMKANRLLLELSHLCTCTNPKTDLNNSAREVNHESLLIAYCVYYIIFLGQKGKKPV